MRARIETETQTYAYRVYVTDSLQAAGKNEYITQRWVDIINAKVDNRSADEVVLDVFKRAGLSAKGGEKIDGCT